MTAHVSADDPRPPTSIRDSGGSMPFSEADFTRDARRLVAEGDRVPAQREDGCQRVMVTPLDGDPYEVVITYVEDDAGRRIRANIKPVREGQEISPDDFRFITGHLTAGNA